MGDGLFGLTRQLRRDLHDEAGTRGCVSAEEQVAFVARVWPEYYPHCAERFAAGDLRAFRRCFGLGEERLVSIVISAKARTQGERWNGCPGAKTKDC